MLSNKFLWYLKHQWGRTVCPFSIHEEMAMTGARKLKQDTSNYLQWWCKYSQGSIYFLWRGIQPVLTPTKAHKFTWEWAWILNVCLVHIFVFAVLQQEDSLPKEFQMVTKTRSINRKSYYTVPLGPSNKDFSLKCSCLSNATAFNPFTPVGPTCLH